MPLKLPAKIKVGPFRFRVVKSTEECDKECPPAAGKGLLFGLCRFSNATIYVREGLPLAVEQDTLLHETLHAAHYTAGWCNDEEGSRRSEEEAVRTLTGITLQLLQENPELVAYLQYVEPEPAEEPEQGQAEQASA